LMIVKMNFGAEDWFGSKRYVWWEINHRILALDVWFLPKSGRKSYPYHLFGHIVSPAFQLCCKWKWNNEVDWMLEMPCVVPFQALLHVSKNWRRKTIRGFSLTVIFIWMVTSSGIWRRVVRWVACWFCRIYFFDPEDGGGMFLRNVSWNSTDYTASYPRRSYSS
jgi:hypothetical protein